MATVWVTLAAEAVVLLALASAAITWVRRTPVETDAAEQVSTSGQDAGQPATPLMQQPA